MPFITTGCVLHRRHDSQRSLSSNTRPRDHFFLIYSTIVYTILLLLYTEPNRSRIGFFVPRLGRMYLFVLLSNFFSLILSLSPSNAPLAVRTRTYYKYSVPTYIIIIRSPSAPRHPSMPSPLLSFLPRSGANYYTMI